MSQADLAAADRVPSTEQTRSWWRGAADVLPGILLTAGIAATAFTLRLLPAVDRLSPLILAIAIGILFQNTIGTPASARAGAAFSMRRILRFAIMLLGVQLTLSQILAVGVGGLAVVVTTLVATFLFTLAIGRAIGVEPKLAELIAAGTSVCGASAVIATNTVTRAREEDVAYAVACVTVFGSAAMLLYPLLPSLLALDPNTYGLWAGASIHEIAQVVAAAFQGGADSGELGTIVKLSRVMLLAPLVLSLAFLTTRRRGERQGSAERVPVPWFVFGFVAVVGINSLGLVPAGAQAWIVQSNGFLLSMALAAMGLGTDVRKLARKGLRPLLLGATSSLFIACLSLLLIKGLL